MHLIYTAYTGSRGRLMETETSDHDITEVMLYTKDELIDHALGLKKIDNIKVHKNFDFAGVVIDLHRYSFHHFVHLLAKGNFNCLDALYSQKVVEDTEISCYLRDQNWITASLCRSLHGFVKSYVRSDVIYTGKRKVKEQTQASIRLQQLLNINNGYSPGPYEVLADVDIAKLLEAWESKDEGCREMEPFELGHIIKTCYGVCNVG